MIQRPRGTRDFLPEDMVKRRYLEKVLRETFLSYGYREVQTPTFEHLELFTAKSGDSIIEEIYSFKDKSGRDLALRPELTAPVIRMYVEKLQMNPKPLKLFYFGNCYRYDRPQKGRYREFTQAGCELIGYSSPEALSELISLAWNCLERAGLKDKSLKIGNLHLVETFLEKHGIKDELKRKILRLVDKRDYDSLRKILENKLSADELTMILDFFRSGSLDKLRDILDGVEELERFEKVIDFLGIFGVDKYEVSMEVVRGLEYYKGIVFEIESPRLGAERQICGGGEYELVGLFGGKEIPTAGFALGFDRVIIALENEGFVFPDERIDFYIIPASRKEEILSKSVKLAMLLRREGRRVDIDLTGRSLRKAMSYADSMGFRKVIIVGEKDLREGKVTVRDMVTGEQERMEVMI